MYKTHTHIYIIKNSSIVSWENAQSAPSLKAELGFPSTHKIARASVAALLQS